MLVDLFDDIGNDRFLRVHVDTGLRQETSQRVHGFEIIGDAHSAHVVCQKSCVIDGLHHGFAVNVRNDRRLRCGRGLCRLCSGWPCRRSCLCRIALRCGLRRQFRRYRPLRHRLRRLCRSFSAGRLCRGNITVAERVEHGQLVRIFIALPARLARRRLISRPQAQRIIVAASQFFGFDICRDRCAFFILQRLYHIIDGCLIKLRQIQMHVVQRLVHVDVLLGGCAHHSAQKLRDIGVIHCTAEGHHNLCSGAVPSCGQRLLKENDLDALVIGDAARLTVWHIQTADLNRRRTLAKGVDNLPLEEAVAKPLFHDAQAFVQIGCGNLMPAAVLNLDDEDRIDLSVVLLVAILIPVLTFLLPLICGCLQHCHIISALLGVGDDDPILQKPGRTHLIRRGLHIVRSGLDAFRQPVETLRCSRHADDHWHWQQTIRFGALQELLHDRGVFRKVSCALRAAMGFIDDEVQPVALLAHGVRERLPDGVLPSIRVLRQIAGFGKLLCVQEVDVAILQHFHVERIVADNNALIQPNLVGLQVDLQPRLLIELRGIRKPDENCFVLLGVQLVSVINILDQRRHDDGLTGSRGRGVGHHLRRVRAPIVAQRGRSALAQFGKRRFLEWE